MPPLIFKFLGVFWIFFVKNLISTLTNLSLTGRWRRGWVDIDEGDNVVDTIICYTRKVVHGLKIFHNFLLDKLFQFERKKWTIMARHILAAAFRIARASWWHNPNELLEGQEPVPDTATLTPHHFYNHPIQVCLILLYP